MVRLTVILAVHVWTHAVITCIMGNFTAWFAGSLCFEQDISLTKTLEISYTIMDIIPNQQY